MRKYAFYILILLGNLTFAQQDTIWFGINSYIVADTTNGPDWDSLFAVRPQFPMNYAYYKDRYVETDLMYKVTDNRGDGFDSLYGTRNMRPILHGVAYRGGANNHYHKTDKRANQNPLPNDGMHGLCAEGFSAGVYLYRENFEHAPQGDTCNCIDHSINKFDYYQYDYYDSSHVYEIIKMTYNSAVHDDVGPVYLHCWNGWHASGYISAVLLKQFCGFSDWDAVNYWDLGTDGANTSPRYQTQRERIKDFKPYPEFMISDSLKDCLCPPMPEFIDSTQLHIEIEHLVVVPEAIPVGFQIVLYNVKFGPGKTTFPGIGSNPDIVYLMQALDKDPNLSVEIGGYTDNSGSYSQNVDLSARRAKFVYDYLIGQGYSAERLSYKGYGPAKPIYSNKYKSTREGNRRIEVKILTKTEHGGTGLVDESVYHNANVDNEEAREKKYLSYFLTHQGQDLGSVFIIDSLIFPSSSAMLPDNGRGIEMLNALVEYLMTNKNVKLNINGYTDASGIEENNIILSQERAKAVYDYLVLNGVAPSRLQHRGWGSENPIAPNRYKWGRDINRRIEIEFVRD